MTRFSVNDAQCAALFASGLQRSDVLTRDAVADAVRRTVQRFGVRGCVALMAQEFGDHPETAMDRMRWIRRLVSEIQASRPSSRAMSMRWTSEVPSPISRIFASR
jgi:hypothetical protein